VFGNCKNWVIQTLNYKNYNYFEYIILFMYFNVFYCLKSVGGSENNTLAKRLLSQ